MKERLDQILLDSKLVETRSKARGLIMDGKVIVNNEKITKPGTLFDREKIKLNLVNEDNQFVSRAGAKLSKALDLWKLDITNKVCLDIGSSTGGFTDCCLQYGANHVFAVDVGTNQLDYRLRTNKRVTSMEKTNFRNVTRKHFDRNIDFFCCDVSFISLDKILKPLKDIVDDNTFGVLLIKPQFELDKEDVKKGKINSKMDHKKAISRVVDYCNANNFRVNGIDFSPILGNKKKNIEYICYIEKLSNVSHEQPTINNILDIVETAWKYFEVNNE